MSIRAAAARDLSRIGTVDDLMLLLARAKADKSPSIRLCAAAAAADVSLRHAHGLTKAQRQALVEEVTSVDPGQNPSLLMALAAVPTAPVIRRLGRLLRDPRYDVRAGAATTLRRLAVSGIQADSRALGTLQSEIRTWLALGKHPADAQLELVRIVGEAGLGTLAEDLRAMASRPFLAEAASEALERLAAREDTAHWGGLWVSWGVDVLQPEPDGPVDWLAVDGVVGVGPAGDRCALTVGAESTLADAPVRLVWASRPDAEDMVPAFQQGGRAYWKMGTKSLVKACHSVLPDLEFVEGAASVVAAELTGIEGVNAKRLRGRLLWRAGIAEEALPLLTELTEQGKPKGEDLWMLAHVHDELGQSEAARVAIAKAIALAPKKCTWRDDAETLAARLSA